VKQNWHLIFAKKIYNLIWYYHTVYPDTSIILIIALLSFVDHDGTANYDCHMKTCSRNYTMYKNNVLICISAYDNYRLGSTRLHSKALNCIPMHSLHSKESNLDSDRLSMEGPYESANQQHALTAWIEGYTKTPSDKKVAVNSLCIIFSKATTFTYEIGQSDPLTQTLFIIKYITANTILSHILHKKYSKLQHTLHIFLHWFPISIHPFLTYSFNTNEGKQKKKTR
jgi:hypothetical protein